METYVTITPKFQVHLPSKARKLSGITSHGRAKLEVKRGKIIISKLSHDIMQWSGKIKIKNPIPADKIRDYIDYSW